MIGESIVSVNVAAAGEMGDGAGAQSGSFDGCFQPALMVSQSDLDPQFNSPECSARYATYLAHKIQGSPTDLTAHVQRIRLLRRLADAESLFGALVDLNIVTGSRGRALRQRLLHEVTHLLDAQRLKQLQQQLSAGVDANDPASETVTSRLTCGHQGNLAITFTETVVIENQGSIIEQAEELINSYQIEAAVELLESAVINLPGDEQLNRELLEIYRRTADVAAFELMHERLREPLENGLVGAPEQWCSTAQFFRSPVEAN